MLQPSPSHPAGRARLAAAALLPVLLAACASASAGRPGLLAPPRLADVIDSVITSPPLDRTLWGIAVRDAQTGEWLVRHNAERKFIPASSTKLVVAAVALAELGPDYRYETPVFARMAPGDTVAAELVVIGRGDPTFSARFHDSDFAVTDTIAAIAASAGLRRVGRVTIDASFFGDALVHPAWEVGDLPAAWAPPIDAFAIGEGTFELVLVGGDKPGERGRITAAGPVGLQPIRGAVLTDTAGAALRSAIDYLARGNGIVLNGRIGAGGVDTARVAVTDPAGFAARAIEFALRTRGIRVDRDAEIVRDSLAARAIRDDLHVGLRRIGTIQSPPLAEIVAGLLQPSQNWMAEQLLKTLGAERRGTGGWNTGIDVERRYLIEIAGIDSAAFFLRDGSGLAPQNLLAPDALVLLLDHARRSEWGEAFRLALPEPGQPNSTLENRMPELAGRLRAKTGTITNVNTLSGYLTTASGRELLFAIMTNGSGLPGSVVRRGIDRIVHALATEPDR